MIGRPTGQAGVWLVVAAAFQWALLGPAARVAFAEGASPLTVAFWRATVASLLFAAHAAVTRAPALRRIDRPWAIGLGVVAVAGSLVVFVAEGGRSLWCLELEADGRSSPARRISPEPDPGSPALYGDGVIDLLRHRWIGVCEQDGCDRLVTLPLHGGGDLSVLAASDDFCGYATLSPDGEHLAWVGWSQPCMPWDRSRLWLAGLAAEGITTVQGIPSAAAAQASAWPWLPEEWVQTPPSGRPPVDANSRSALVTPRILKAPDF